jgi:tryptophan-rich sensory protein
MLIGNALWSPVFFKYHYIGWALMVLSFYIIMLGAWVRILYQENKISAYLQIPHLLWVASPRWLTRASTGLTNKNISLYALDGCLRRRVLSNVRCPLMI